MIDSLFHLFWTTVWQSTVLAAVVFVVIFLFGSRLQARFRYLLWCVVLLRLAVPVLPVTSWGIFSGHETTTQQAAIVAKNNDAPSITEHANPPATFETEQVAVMDVPFEPEPASEIHEHVAPPAASTVVARKPSVETIAETPEIVVSESKTPVWKLAILLVWVIGIVLFGIRYLLDEIQLFRQSRDWRPVDDPALRMLLQQCRREVGLWRPVRFLVVPQEIGAASTGFWRASVLISRTAIGSVTPEQLRMILLHELVHIKRWDPAVLRIVSLLNVIYWPHPVVWFVLSRLQRDREPACDAAVLHILNQRKTAAERRSNQSAYGKTVLMFAQATSAKRCLPGLVGASLDYRRHNTLARRIEMILKHKQSTILQAALGVLLVTIFTAFGLTRAAEKSTPETPPDVVVVATESPQNDDNPQRSGTTVTGRITLPASIRERFTANDWSENHLTLSTVNADGQAVERKAGLTQSPVDPQTGLFRCENVSPGHWCFSAEIFQSSKNSTGEAPPARFFLDVTIPEQDMTFDIGSLPQLFELKRSTILVFKDGQWKNDTTDEILPPETRFRNEKGIYSLHEHNGEGRVELLTEPDVTKRSGVGQGKHVTFSDGSISVASLTPEEMKNIIVMATDDVLVFDNGQWTNEKTGETIASGTIIAGPRGAVRLHQKDDDAAVELIAGACVSGQGRYIRLFNGGDGIDTRYYNSADIENSIEMTMDDVFVFQNGQWSNERTGERIMPGVLVRGTRGLLRLNKDGDEGRIEVVSGGGSTGKGKSIRLSDGGNAISTGP